jgi:hypothetical protein
MTELTKKEKLEKLKENKEFFDNLVRLKEETPKGIQGDDIYTKIEITHSPIEMRGKNPGEIMEGYANPISNTIKLLATDRILEVLLHEWMHQVIFHSGFGEKFNKIENEVFVRIITRGFKQYSNALSMRKLELEKGKKTK